MRTRTLQACLLASWFTVACGGKAAPPADPASNPSAAPVGEVTPAPAPEPVEPAQPVADAATAAPLDRPRHDHTAKVAADATVSVMQEVVKSHAGWKQTGKLDTDGTFTATTKSPNTTIAISSDGKLDGMGEGMDIRIDAADPAHRRGAMLVVIAMFAAVKMETNVSGASSSSPVPVSD